jgi:ABC-type multidrug transport system fused ATPase/permease subunit
VDAARIANAHDFVSKMERGYDSEVGAGGRGFYPFTSELTLSH